MFVRIKREADYTVEAVELLMRYANQEKYTEIKQNLLNKYTFTDRHVEDNIDKVISISEYVYEHMEIPDDKLEFYFHKMNEENLCLAQGILLLHPDFVTDTFEERIELIKSLKRQELLSRMINIYSEGEWTEGRENQDTVNSLKEQLELIEKLDMAVEDKWKLERAILHYNLCFNELTHIIKKVIELINHCGQTIKDLADHCCNYWDNYLKENSIEEFMEKSFHIRLGKIMEEVCIIPAIAGCNSIAFKMSDSYKQPPKNILYIYAGVLFDDSFNNSKKPIEQPELYNILKMLGDKSKADILLSIKEEPAYGQELAVRLGLTTATISHHVTALIRSGLVHVNRESNRLYYSLNKEKLEEFLKTVRHIFLEP